jgi:hypothetical protein
MVRGIWTCLLITGCGAAVTQKIGSATGSPQAISPGISMPAPTVALEGRSGVLLRVADPYQGDILLIKENGQIILRGEVIADDEALAETLRWKLNYEKKQSSNINRCSSGLLCNHNSYSSLDATQG